MVFSLHCTFSPLIASSCQCPQHWFHLCVGDLDGACCVLPWVHAHSACIATLHTRQDCLHLAHQTCLRVKVNCNQTLRRIWSCLLLHMSFLLWRQFSNGLWCNKQLMPAVKLSLSVLCTIYLPTLPRISNAYASVVLLCVLVCYAHDSV